MRLAVQPLAGAAAARVRRGGRASALRFANRKNALRLLSLGVVFSAWELWGQANPFFVSYPSAIAAAAGEMFWSDVAPAFITTLTALAVGMALATPIGMVTGFAMGRIKLLDIALTPYVNAIYATPRIALIPVLVLWLGIDFALRVAIVAIGAVFPIIVNTYAGTRNVDPELLDVGRAFTARPSQVLRTIVLPSALPFIFAGIRIGLGKAVSGVIVAEMTSTLTGIGRLLISTAKYLQIAELFVAVMTLGVFSLFLMEGLTRLQRWLTPWGNTERTR